MLNLSFQPWGTKEQWRKLYGQPSLDITKNVIVVDEDDEWAGGGTVWFREVFLKNGKRAKVSIDADAYVHPDHRGKGVFSTITLGRNKLARRGGSCLGFSFVSAYGIPFSSLPKYGFVDMFHPVTKILILNPEKSIPYIIKKVKGVNFPKKFEDMKLKLIVSVPSLKQKFTVSKIFEIRNGRLSEITEEFADKIDLKISTDIATLHKIFKSFYLRKKTLYLILLISLLLRRFKLRFSTRFLKTVLGL